MTAPDAVTVEALEAYGYKAAAVRKWTREKALVALDARRREEAIARRRALKRAEEEGRESEAAPARGQPLGFIRLEAAKYLEQPMSIDDLSQAVAYSVCHLTDAEVKRLAGYLIRLFRGEA
jgi:NAD(P)-dependent dehydrogenase (short-subunit alcohol dehydrogenase family)